MPRVALPKILPPRPGRIARRSRVAQVLLAASAHGAAWVQAPAGWGKTTAVAALAEDLKHPVVWLHLDAGDAEALTFFHFLRLATVRALPRSERALPVFAKELARDAALYARRFARAALASAPASGATLVLDNLQDVPEDSSVHAFAAAIAEELAPAWRVFLVTREAPGRAYLRLRGQGRLEPVAPEAFAFSDVELKQALRERGFLDEGRLEALARRSGGWIAGAVLLALQGDAGVPGDDASSSDPAVVFDYFATQALANRPEDDRRLLLRTAFLNTITPEAAARIGGPPDAGKRLERLARGGLFTTSLSTQPARYRYHDLFRDYLRSEARASLEEAELDALKRASAAELLGAGDSLAALELLCECSAWDELAATVPAAARQVLAQGQHGAMAQVLRRMPAELIEEEPWVLYWLGQCEARTSDERGCVTLMRAYDAFERRSDRRGQLLAAIEVPYLLHMQNASLEARPTWIARIERLADAAETLEAPDLRLKALTGLVGLHESAAIEQRAEEWVRRIFEVLPAIDDIDLRMQALTRVAMVAWKTNRPELAPPALAMVAGQELERRASPLLVLHWYYEAITYDTIFGDRDRAMADGDRMEAIAQQIGLPYAMFDAVALRLETTCDANDLPRARELFARLVKLADPNRPASLLIVAGVDSRIALLENDGPRALAQIRLMGDRVEALGGKRGQRNSIAYQEVAALAVLGRYDDALDRCAEYLHTLLRYARHHLETTRAWVHAAQALDRGDAQARGLLSEAMADARAHRDVHPLRFANHLVARLCAQALAWNIEPEFVRRVIARRRLRPPDPDSPDWPWPLRVRCLGRFALERDGEPVAERARSQKSLELLQLAIALDGDQVPVDRIVKILWPGEGREGAQQAFDTTLHRLRKLLDADDAIRVSDRRLSIDRRGVWVDALALVGRLDAVERSAGGADRESLRAVVDLYAGHFLPHRGPEPWAAEARERLWGRTRRALIASARGARSRGDDAQAERILYFVADLDPLAEDAIAQIMRLHLDLGQPAEALRAFRRCEAALAAQLRIEPGAELRALVTATAK